MSKISETGFLDYIFSFDICCLIETFTYPNFDFRTYFDDYLVFHSPGVKLSKQGRLSGGITVFVKKTLSDSITKLVCEENLVVFRLCNKSFGDNIIMTVYIPPTDSPFYSDQLSKCSITVLEDRIIRFQEQFPNANILICGDLNARIGQWDLHDDDSDDLHNSPFYIQPVPVKKVASGK